MKKIIIISLATLALSITQADYTFKTPIETDKGGYISNGSVQFKSPAQSPQEPDLPAEIWQTYTPEYSEWVDSGEVTGCSDWTPESSTVTVGKYFTQTATDCQQHQVRSVQDREVEQLTGMIRYSGEAYTNNQQIPAISSRDILGSKETWVAISSTYTDWVNSGEVTGCANWTPAVTTITMGQSFTQSATDCKQAQTNSRQDREQETTTKDIRNKGLSITENQIITSSSTRTSTGTKPAEECDYKWHNYTDFTNQSYFQLKYDNYMGYGWGTGIFWKGQTIYYNYVNTYVTSINYGGYRYYMGPLIDATESTYQVCRTPI